MTDETTGTGQPPGAPASAPDAPASGPTTGEAWRDVVAQADGLADAIAAWAKTAYNDPEYRVHADEIGAKLKDMGEAIGDGIQHVADSDFGQKMTETADKVGDAFSEGADKVTKAAGPHVAKAFAGISSVLQKAADSVDDAVHRHESAAPQAPAAETPVAPAPPAAPVDDESA